jgi:hypothetical protein
MTDWNIPFDWEYRRARSRGIPCLKPGAGAGKNLGVLGDTSIIGIVTTKSNKNYNLLNLTRLNLVYRLAEKIADGIEKYILSFEKEFQNKPAI